MKKHIITASIILLHATLTSSAATNEWTNLLNAKLTHWELWMGVPHESVKDLPPGTPTSPDGHKGTPLGLHNDPKHVFTVIEEDGQPVLKITGEIFGGLTTLQEYDRYHFTCEVKFGEKKWAPRENKERDSGILYHCTGKHGAFWNVWMRSIEFQVIEEGMGDLYLLSGTVGDTRAMPREKNQAPAPYKGTWDPTQPYATMVPVQRSANFEGKHGEWTKLDLFVVGNQAVHLVNGHVVMAVDKLRLKDGGPLSKGKIQLQSEAAEVYYRNIKVQPIEGFPAEILKVSGLDTPASK